MSAERKRELRPGRAGSGGIAPLGLGAALLLVACGGASAFVCERDDQCTRASAEGTCETGHCAFPDPECPSGKRFAELSGERAGECVPGDGTSTGNGTNVGDGTNTGGDTGAAASSAGVTTGGDTLAVSASAGETSSGAATDDDAITNSTGASDGSTDSGGITDAVHNYVFVTSSAAPIASLGGLVGADARCNDLAADAGLPGQYVAWLSTIDTDAIDRLGTAEGWARVDGRPFVRSQAALAQRAYLYPIRLDEHGVDLEGANVVTGTAGDGTHVGPSDCDGWTSAVGEAVRASSDALGEPFTNNFEASCDVSIRTYCFGIDDAVDIAVVLPPAGRRAFITSDAVAASAGLDAFDARCQTEADAAGLPGTFLAFAATTTTPATDRFDLTDTPWSLPNDVAIVQDAADLATPGATLLAPIWLGAAGTDDGNGVVWQGSTGPGLPATVATSCEDWTGSTGDALTGPRHRSSVWWGTTVVPCSSTRRVFCLQQ